MSVKRAEKLKKLERRRATKERGRHRRQERLRDAVPQAISRRYLQEIDTFFQGYHAAPDPEAFTAILAKIHQMRLLLQEEHRYPVGAAVASIYRDHPSHQAAWRRDYAAEIHSACHLWPDLDADDDDEFQIDRPDRLDQCAMAWLVTRDWTYIEIIRENLEGPYAEDAEDILSYHAERHPDLLQGLQEVEDNTEELTKVLPGIPEHARKRVDALVRRLMDGPDWHKVVFVNYDQGRIIIGTMTGKTVEGTASDPLITARQATPDEIQVYQNAKRDLEDPI